MKFLLALLLSITLNCSYSQEIENCQILKVILENKATQKTFFIDKYKDLPIIIVDVKNNFNSCRIENVTERKVNIVHDSSYLNEKGAPYIIIYNVKRFHRGKYSVEIHQKYTGAYGYIHLKKRKKGIAVSKSEVGYF